MEKQLSSTVVRLYGVWGEDPRRRVAKALESVRGVRRVRVDVFRAEASVIHENRCDEERLIDAVEACGFGAEPAGRERRREIRGGGPKRNGERT